MTAKQHAVKMTDAQTFNSVSIYLNVLHPSVCAWTGLHILATTSNLLLHVWRHIQQWIRNRLRYNATLLDSDTSHWPGPCSSTSCKFSSFAAFLNKACRDKTNKVAATHQLKYAASAFHQSALFSTQPHPSSIPGTLGKVLPLTLHFFFNEK